MAFGENRTGRPTKQVTDSLLEPRSLQKHWSVTGASRKGNAGGVCKCPPSPIRSFDSSGKQARVHACQFRCHGAPPVSSLRREQAVVGAPPPARRFPLRIRLI